MLLFFIRLIRNNDFILSGGPHFIFKDNSGTDMAFKSTDPDLKFFFVFCVKFGNPENSDYFCCFYPVLLLLLLLLFVAGFPNPRTHPSIANTRHSVSTGCILVHWGIYTYYRMSTRWNVCLYELPKHAKMIYNVPRNSMQNLVKFHAYKFFL